ncbi:MAG: PqqD family protein [Gammaproteobacteria bacterium]|nr:PqqD family protein [Gammaproteobacteria bacterium]
MHQSYQLRSQAIIHELLDREIIVADLDTGVYYSLRETGVPVWQMLLAGQTKESIVQAVVARYPDVSPVMICEDVEKHIQDLLSIQILVPRKEASSEALLNESLVWELGYYFPVFEQFNDMQQLLMLDPIHEVDEQGWPHQEKI